MRHVCKYAVIGNHGLIKHDSEIEEGRRYRHFIFDAYFLNKNKTLET